MNQAYSVKSSAIRAAKAQGLSRDDVRYIEGEGWVVVAPEQAAVVEIEVEAPAESINEQQADPAEGDAGIIDVDPLWVRILAAIKHSDQALLDAIGEDRLTIALQKIRLPKDKAATAPKGSGPLSLIREKLAAEPEITRGDFLAWAAESGLNLSTAKTQYQLLKAKSKPIPVADEAA